METTHVQPIYLISNYITAKYLQQLSLINDFAVDKMIQAKVQLRQITFWKFVRVQTL